MDIMDVLASLSKISLVAFLATTFFLVYQIYIIRREFSRRRGKPIIPDFDEAIAKKRKINSILIKQKAMMTFKKSKLIYFIVMIVFIIVSLLIFVISGTVLMIKQKNSVSTIKPTPIINFVASNGIRVYNEKWGELTGQEMQNLKPGENIIIGIETIPNVDIDKARIRVNENEWKTNHVTQQFNKAKNVYYLSYAVSSQSAMLKIDAQLHSKSDNWLGD